MIKSQENTKIRKKSNSSKKYIKSRKAVTNVVGTILILTIAVSLTTGVYLLVVNSAVNDQNAYPPRTIIIGAIKEENKVILEHRGGDPLALDTIIKLNIAGEMIEFVAERNLSDEFKADHVWAIGEYVEYNHSSELDFIRLEVQVIDPPTNSMIMNVVIQEGELDYNPFVRTNHSDERTSSSARLHLYFNFRNHTFGTGAVRFRYRPKDGKWQNTSWYEQKGNISGIYNETVYNLIANWYYQFVAEIKYNVSGDPDVNTSKLGAIHDFWTFDWRRGIWHFNEGFGDIAFDLSEYENDGSIEGWAAWVPIPGGINDTSALSFDGIDDYVEVDDHFSLDLDEAITVEAWLKPLEHKEGFVGKPSLNDTSAFGITNFDCYEPDFIHVAGDIYAIACRNERQHGFVVTVEILADGTIIANASTCIIDSLEFETSDWRCEQPDIIHISGNIYAVVYRGRDNDGYLKTFIISGDGTITYSDDEEFFDSDCNNPKIIKVSGDWYAIVYQGGDTHGRVTTVEIDFGGTIGPGGETLNFLDVDTDPEENTSKMYEPDIILVDWQDTEGVGVGVYAIAFRNHDGDGVIRTIDIDNAGHIGFITKFTAEDDQDTYTFDGSNGFWPDIIHIDNNVYAIAYGGGPDENQIKGEVHTIIIENNGDVTLLANFFEFETTINEFRYPEIIPIGEDYYAIAYQGPSSNDDDGWLKIVKIQSDGTITQSVIDQLEFDVYDGQEPSILHVDGDVYAIVYREGNSSRDGVLKTIEIDSNAVLPGNIIPDDAVINAHELGIFNCYESNILHIYQDIYAIAYRGLNQGGWIKTVKVANDGNINNTFIDTFEIEPGWLCEPGGDNYFYHLNFTHVFQDIYVVVYKGPDSDGWLKTVSISDEGEISYVHQLEYNTTNAEYPDIIYLSSVGNFHYFAIAFRDNYGDGRLKTVKIDNDGDISFVDLNYPGFEFDENNCVDPDIIHVSGDTYAIAYEGPGSDGTIVTVNISSIGIITEAVISSQIFDVYCKDPEIIHVYGTFYAIVYQGPDNDGWLITGNISDAGIIADNLVDSMEFDTYCIDPNIIHIDGRVFTVVYRGPGYDGWMKSFRIGENGNISDSCDETLKFDQDYCYYNPEIIHVYGDTYAIVYGGGNGHYYFDTYLRTVEIKLEETTRDVIVKGSAYSLKANATKVFATIFLAEMGDSQELSVNLSEGWNHIALTYNGSSEMKLYRNATEEIVSVPLTGDIAQTDIDLIFGDYNCILDEIIIYSMALTQEDIIGRFENPYP